MRTVPAAIAWTAIPALMLATADAQVRLPQPLTVYDRVGNVVSTLGESADYTPAAPAFSPDGTRLAIVNRRAPIPTIEVFDLSTGANTPITFPSGVKWQLDWSPDGRHLAFVARRGDYDDLYRIRYSTGRVWSEASAAIAVVLSAGVVRAHHSYTVVFDPSRTVTLAGTLTKVDWRNPHIELALERKTGDRMETWVIEGGPPRFFQRRKTDKTQFTAAIGQTVTIDALPARDGTRLGALLKISFPDGTFATSAPGA